MTKLRIQHAATLGQEYGLTILSIGCRLFSITLIYVERISSSCRRTFRKSSQSEQSYAAFKIPARMNGSPNTNSDPWRSTPERAGLLAEPTLRANDVTLAAAVRSSGATRAIV